MSSAEKRTSSFRNNGLPVGSHAMRLDLGSYCADLAEVEKSLPAKSNLSFKGSFEHWTLLNTLNHVYCWKNAAIKKIQERLLGKDIKFHDGTPLDEINRDYYEKTKRAGLRKTIECIESTERKIDALLKNVSGSEASTEIVPIGFYGTVFDYLKFDLIYHSVNHYLHYSIKNDEYAVFLAVEKYISDNRSSIYRDFGILNLKELIGKKEANGFFDKGYEWEHDDLFIQIKSMTQ
jgi:hypothetical protein